MGVMTWLHHRRSLFNSLLSLIFNASPLLSLPTPPAVVCFMPCVVRILTILTRPEPRYSDTHTPLRPPHAMGRGTDALVTRVPALSRTRGEPLDDALLV